MKLASTFALMLLLAGGLEAQTQSSANYSIVTETLDGGGASASVGLYSNSGSVSPIAGTSSVATGGASANYGYVDGYIGQLYNVTGLTVTGPSSPAVVDGGATLQLGAWQNLDDGSYLAVAPGSVGWSILSGPITSISAAGLAAAGAVTQNTAASVRGVSAAIWPTWD
jgi:hypothetical protein